MRPRVQVTDRGYFALGFKLGYWPCLSAPFVQLVVLRWRIDFWIGRPSYRADRRDAAVGPPRGPVPAATALVRRGHCPNGHGIAWATNRIRP
jgi:hypothetical protein